MIEGSHHARVFIGLLPEPDLFELRKNGDLWFWPGSTFSDCYQGVDGDVGDGVGFVVCQYGFLQVQPRSSRGRGLESERHKHHASVERGRRI